MVETLEWCSKSIKTSEKSIQIAEYRNINTNSGIVFKVNRNITKVNRNIGIDFKVSGIVFKVNRNITKVNRNIGIVFKVNKNIRKVNRKSIEIAE